MPSFSSEAALIDEVEQRLGQRFAQLPSEEITHAVTRAHARFAQSPVRDFISLLVERRAGAELSRHADQVVAR
jgi:hypothetical protein